MYIMLNYKNALHNKISCYGFAIVRQFIASFFMVAELFYGYSHHYQYGFAIVRQFIASFFM